MNPLDLLKNNPRLCWLVWFGFVALWTTGLVFPMPEQRFSVEETTRRFLVGKAVHVAAYAVMTMLSGYLRLPIRFRLLLLFFLMFHAAVTEFIQLSVSNRSGTLQDVVLDHLGILAGLMLSWQSWSKP
jgi:VanZ family protein